MTDYIERETIAGDNQYVPHSKEEVRQLALDLMTGQALGSWQLRDHDANIIHLVFLPLVGASDIHLKQWERDEVLHVYGNMRDSLSRSINGYPIFMGFRVINDTDLKRVYKMIERLHAIEEDD